MALTERKTLIENISPPLDRSLAAQLVDEFISCERRYIQCDWEPAELDGGQFCEILARILYYMDSGSQNLRKPLDDCLKYIENYDNSHNHKIQPRQHSLHLAKVIRTVYKFRSQRGAVHISPTYEPNQMDARFVIEAVRWMMNETLRIFWKDNREQVAKIIREILQFDVPCIGNFSNLLLVQRTDISADEEILLLLHYAGDAGMSRTDLGTYCMFSQSSVTMSLHKLAGQGARQIVKLTNGHYRLTDLGSKRIRENLAPKLLLQ